MRRSNKFEKQALAVVAVILVGAAVFGYLSRDSHESHEQPGEKNQKSPVANPSAPLGRAGQNPAVAVSVKPAAEADAEWRKFQEQFGSHLEPAFTPDHRLVRVRAEEAAGNPADHFLTGNKDAALARGQEILQRAGDLLGLKPEFPLQARSVRSDDVSSQVEWEQTYHGVPVEPFGKITLQLDAEGGLRGLYSNYISDPVIVNAPSLDVSAARTQAFSHLHFTPDRPLESGPAPKGDLILFARGPQDSSQPVELKYAYRYWVSGHEVVVDAAQGEILSEKDRRQF